MIKSSLLSRIAFGLFAFCFAATPVFAITQLTQTFVSSAGQDTNPCTQAQPCATFGQAILTTLPGGEVDALTTGNFGAFTVSHSMTIDGKGLASVDGFDLDSAVEINASSTDSVILRGVTINGAHGGNFGVDYAAGGSVLIEGSTISGFIYDSILDVTTGATTLVVKNSALTGAQTGVYANQTGGTTVLDHVTISGFTTYGIQQGLGTGNVIVNDSTISGGQYGICVHTASTGSTVMIERSTISGASVAGAFAGRGTTSIDASTLLLNNFAVEATNGGIVRISNNNIYSNKSSYICNTSGVVQTASNNRFGSDVGSSTPDCTSIVNIPLG